MKNARILSRSIATLLALSPFAAYPAADTLSGASPAWGNTTAWSLSAIPLATDNAIVAATGTVDVRGSTLGGSKEIQDLAFNAAAAVSLVNNSSSVDMLLILNGGRGATVPLIATVGDFAYAITGPGTNAAPHPLNLQLKASGDISVAANILTITSVISQSGARSINKTGAGRLILGGANTFSGGVNITGGVLEVTANGGLGLGPAVITGGTLEINLAAAALTTADLEVNAGGQIATKGAITLSNAMTLNGGTLATRTADGGTYAGAINVVASSFANLRSYTTTASDLSITISGLLSGAGALTINGNATNATSGKALLLTNTANNYSGIFHISANQALRSAPAVTGNTLGTSTIDLSGGTLQLRDDGVGSDGTLTYGNNVNVTATSTINVDRVSANTGNTFQLGALNVASGQTLHTTGANNYIVRFGGATTLNAGVIFNPTTAPLVLGGVVGGAFPLTKTGTGNLVLAAANTYTGNTNINEGTAILTGSVATSPRLDVKAGATLEVAAAAGGFTLGAAQILSGAGAVTGAATIANGSRIEAGDATGAGTLTMSNLTFASAGTLVVNPTASALPLRVTAPNGLSAGGGAGSVAINIAGLAPALGQHVLVAYSGLIGGTFNRFALGTLPTPRLVAELLNNTADINNQSIDLKVTGIDFPIWKGSPSNQWSTAALSNWVLDSNNAIPTDFLTNDSVVFNDFASGAATSVLLTTADVTPSATLFNNASNPYTLTGTKAVAGSGGLTKTGAAKVSISTANTFTGPVSVSGAGLLSVPAVADAGAASPLGAGTTITLDGGTLEFTGAGGSTNRPVTLGASGGTLSADPTTATLTLTGVVSGSVLTKAGAGKVILTAAVNTYTNTTISAGILQFGDGITNGTPGSGTITNNATLAFNNPLAQTVGTEIVGTGALTKTGAGLLVLSGGGANTYTGTTTVSGGNLILSKTSGVNAIGGDVVVQAGGTVSYGTTAGQLQDHLIDSAKITVNGGTFGSGAGNTDAGPTTGISDTVARVTVNSGTFLSGRGAVVGPATRPTPFVVTGAFEMTGGTALVQRGGGLTADSVKIASPAVMNLDGGSGTPDNQSRLTVGAGGLLLTGATINFNGGPNTPNMGSVIDLNGSVTSTGTSALARANPTLSSAVVGLGAAIRTFSVTGILTVAPDVGAVATDLASAGILKNGAGKLVLTGAQNYASLTNDAGRTDVTKAIGTGTSTVTASAGEINLGASQTLASLTIGNGAVVTLSSTLPPAPPEAGLAFEGGPSGAAVPEPGSAALLLGGIATLLGLRRRA